MDAWQRIEDWLRTNSPRAFKDLGKPASQKKIAAAEKKLDVRYPQDVVQAYLRHDGQSGIGPPMAGDWMFLPLKAVESQWAIQQKLSDEGAFAGSSAKAKGPVRPVWWNSKWIPIMYNGSGDLQCIDLDPADGGKAGQLIVYWHDRELRECVADSFDVRLKALADDMENGRFKVQPNGRLIPQ